MQNRGGATTQQATRSDTRLPDTGAVWVRSQARYRQGGGYLVVIPWAEDYLQYRTVTGCYYSKR